jgi:TonB family C-terminal domain
MTYATTSIPISRKIQSFVLAALVTVVVMCIFPLMEQFAENTQQPIVHSQPVPVKIAQILPEVSTSVTQQVIKGKNTPQRRLSPVALPPAPIAPKVTPHLILPPKAPPVTVAPPTEIPSPSPAPIVQNQQRHATQDIPAPKVSDVLPTTAATTATYDAPSTETLQADGDGMPDGKSLKFPPVFSKHIMPIYPEYARRRGIEGFVILQFIVDINGRVTNPTVHQSNPQGHFETAALRAIKQWQFSPGRNDHGTPIPCRLQMRIEFKLKNPTSYGH